MKRYKVTVEIEFEASFDENSKEFNGVLASYRRIIDKEGDGRDIINHIAYSICQFGTDHFIEGVGYVSVNGTTPMNYKTGIYEESCGVEITGDFNINGMPDWFVDSEEI